LLIASLFLLSKFAKANFVLNLTKLQSNFERRDRQEAEVPN
jgi:hypothetical protein